MRVAWKVTFCTDRGCTLGSMRIIPSSAIETPPLHPTDKMEGTQLLEIEEAIEKT